VTPALRRAFHQALDLVLDALAEDARNDNARPKKKHRTDRPAKTLPPLPSNLTKAEKEAIEQRLERQGFRKTA
jgi:hypothetical protein